MGRKRKGSVRRRGEKLNIGFRLTDGRWWEREVPAPTDGGELDETYARLVLAKAIHAYESGKWDPLAESEKPVAAIPLTVLETALAWVKEQTYESQPHDLNRLDTHLTTAPLGAMRLEDVRPVHALAYIAWLKKRPSKKGGCLGASAVRSVYGLVQRVFDRAVIEERIPANPLSLGKVRDALPALKDKKPGARALWRFSIPEVLQMTTSPKIKLSRRVRYAVLFLTGMRFGELAALRWRDLDLDASPLGKITVSRAIGSISRTEGQTKTGAIKEIPALPALRKILLEWKSAGWVEAFGREPQAEDLVLPSVRGTTRGLAANYKAASPAFKADQRRVQSVRVRHMYCARHTLIRLLRDAGASRDVVRWATHAPAAAVYDGYAHAPSWALLCAEFSKLPVEFAGVGRQIGRQTTGHSAPTQGIRWPFDIGAEAQYLTEPPTLPRKAPSLRGSEEGKVGENGASRDNKSALPTYSERAIWAESRLYYMLESAELAESDLELKLELARGPRGQS